MREKMYLTAEGAARLRDELEHLKSTARDEMAKRLRDAIQMGDLSENADYIKAKEDQGFLEGRIQELEHLLKYATIIENNGKAREIVEVGASVTIQEGEYPPETYLIVGAKEADPRNGKISHESPIGSALIGCKAGDEVQVGTPGGSIKLKILNIE